MKVLFKLIAALVLTTSTLVAHAEIDKVIMSNSDAASVISDRYAKKNCMSIEAARRELTEAGVFKDANGGSRTAAASEPAKARETTVYAAAKPTATLVIAAHPIVVAKAATAPAVTAFAPAVVANSETPEVKTAPTPAVVTAKPLPDTTTALVAAAPVVWPSFVMQIEKMVMADGGFATWQWLTLLSLLAALVLMRWFKKSPQSIIVNAPANSVPLKKAISEPVHIGNLSFYVPVVLDTRLAKPARVHIDSNVVFGSDFKTPLSRLHQILTKADETAPVEPNPEMRVLNINAADLPKHVITPNTAPSDSNTIVVFGRSRAQDKDNRLFGTNFKTPKSKLRDLISAPSSTLTQADV